MQKMYLKAIYALTLAAILVLAAHIPASSTVFLAAANATPQCPVTELTSGLHLPLGITQSNQGNLLVSESGTRTPNSGRISIIDLGGNRRTLLDGLPSGLNDVNEPSGPAGLFIRGRTLYVVIGVGDSVLPGPVPNPVLSSPIFSSVLAIHLSARVEQTTAGFTLTSANQQALAAGQKVTLTNDAGETLTVELIANLPDSTPDPTSPTGLRHTNPFDLVVADDQVYVTDGGQNSLWQLDIPTGAFSILATFPQVANPLPFGPPFIDAVPTGIAYSDGQLLVTLFRGFPFPPDASVVEQVDPQTGTHSSFIGGRTAAIDVLTISEGGDTDHLVLQFASGAILSGPGLLLRFETPGGPPTILADCLLTPTSMALDEKTGTLYVTEVATGRVVAIPVAP
jgi:hypothetical protein